MNLALALAFVICVSRALCQDLQHPFTDQEQVDLIAAIQQNSVSSQDDTDHQGTKLSSNIKQESEELPLHSAKTDNHALQKQQYDSIDNDTQINSYLVDPQPVNFGSETLGEKNIENMPQLSQPLMQIHYPNTQGKQTKSLYKPPYAVAAPRNHINISKEILTQEETFVHSRENSISDKQNSIPNKENSIPDTKNLIPGAESEEVALESAPQHIKMYDLNVPLQLSMNKNTQSQPQKKEELKQRIAKEIIIPLQPSEKQTPLENNHPQNAKEIKQDPQHSTYQNLQQKPLEGEPSDPSKEFSSKELPSNQLPVKELPPQPSNETPPMPTKEQLPELQPSWPSKEQQPPEPQPLGPSKEQQPPEPQPSGPSKEQQPQEPQPSGPSKEQQPPEPQPSGPSKEQQPPEPQPSGPSKEQQPPEPQPSGPSKEQLPELQPSWPSKEQLPELQPSRPSKEQQPPEPQPSGPSKEQQPPEPQPSGPSKEQQPPELQPSWPSKEQQLPEPQPSKAKTPQTQLKEPFQTVLYINVVAENGNHLSKERIEEVSNREIESSARNAQVSVDHDRGKGTTSASTSVTVISIIIISVTIVATSVGVYKKKITLHRQRYGGRIVLPDSDDEHATVYSRRGYNQQINTYESWMDVEH